MQRNIYYKSIKYDTYIDRFHIDIEIKVILFQTYSGVYNLSVFTINKSFNRIHVMNELIDTYNDYDTAIAAVNKYYEKLKKGVQNES